MKKALLISLILALIFSVSCASQSEETVPMYDGETVTTYDGYDFRIFQCTIEDSGVTYLDSSEEGNIFGYVATTSLADDIMQRISDIEEEMKCTVTIEYSSDSPESVAAKIMVNSYVAEALFSANQSFTHTLKYSSVLYPFDELDTIDITDEDKWGGANILEIHAREGHAYGLCPMNWLYKQPRSIGIFVINTGLEKKYNVTNPHEYLEDGSWTWDTFEKTLLAHTVNTGDDTIYGLACRYFDLVKLSVYSNGCSDVVKNENGTYESGLTSEEAMAGYEWAKKLATEYKDCLEFGTNDKNWPDTTESMINEHSMMILTAPSIIFNSIIYSVDEYSFMPFPSGKDAVYGEFSSAIEAAENFSVFLNCREPEASGTLINMLCEPMDSYPTKDAMANYLANNVLFSRTDADILLSLHKNGHYTYWNGTNIDSYWRAFQGDGITKKSIAQILQSYESLITSVNEEYIIPNQTLYDLFDN